MTHTNQAEPAAAHTPEPWDCDGRTTLYAVPHEGDEITMIEVRANVTEAGWDTVAFVEAIWPAADVNARRLCAAVNACKGLSTEALEDGVVVELRHALGAVLAAAADLDAALDGATGLFDSERTRLNAAISSARASLDAGTEIDLHELLASRGQIAILWSIEDVQEVRPDLTAKQAWEVLKQFRDQHDATLGVTWETLEWAAQDLFGDAPDTDAA